MITKKEVEHIAKLARLGLSPAEVKKMENELSAILDYFEKLKKIDVSKTQPFSNPHLLENVTREDQTKKQEIEKVNKLVKAIPEKEGRYAKVKAVL